MGFQISVKAIPAKTLNFKAVRREVQKALEETGKVLQKEFAKTTSEWKGDKPTFAVTTGGVATSGGGRAFVRCYPSGDPNGVIKWVRLDEGTKHDYPITPHGNYPLRFLWQGRGRSYSARTRPRQLGSGFGSGEKMGTERKEWVGVTHPGVDPREWSIVLGEQEIGPFAARIWAAVKKGLEE